MTAKWDTRDMLVATCALVSIGISAARLDAESQPSGQNTGELLYNGIRLPEAWPPVNIDPENDAPMDVPYLRQPPAVIPIDVGRQLFVDDFLVEQTDLQRVVHPPERYGGNPVLTAQTEGELKRGGSVYTAHGGVFFDPTAGHFKMFYGAGWRGPVAMATSRDLIHWTRPKLSPENDNAVYGTKVDDNCIWLDLETKRPEERFKMMEYMRGGAALSKRHWGDLYTSPDGLHWSGPVQVVGPESGRDGDYSSFFRNPFRDVWVFSIKRHGGGPGRRRYYHESAEFLQGNDWSNKVYWTRADRLDLPEPGDGPRSPNDPACQLYSLDAVAYESVMVSMHYILRGKNNKQASEAKTPKLIDLKMGFSRDGFHWSFPTHRPFLAGTRRDGDWDRAYLHSAAGLFAVFGDKLVFPYTGYSGVAPNGNRGVYNGASIGIATLRRDGFVSLDAGPQTGTLTTRPLRFSGKHLFVNADAPRGRLRVEIRDLQGKPVAPFTLANCVPFQGDSTIESVRWKNGDDLSSLAGQPMRLHFELTGGSLYSFWVSRDASGRSDGYVAAGGPGHSSNIDTIGRAATGWQTVP